MRTLAQCLPDRLPGGALARRARLIGFCTRTVRHVPLPHQQQHPHRGEPASAWAATQTATLPAAARRAVLRSLVRQGLAAEHSAPAGHPSLSWRLAVEIRPHPVALRSTNPFAMSIGEHATLPRSDKRAAIVRRAGALSGHAKRGHQDRRAQGDRNRLPSSRMRTRKGVVPELEPSFARQRPFSHNTPPVTATASNSTSLRNTCPSGATAAKSVTQRTPAMTGSYPSIIQPPPPVLSKRDVNGGQSAGLSGAAMALAAMSMERSSIRARCMNVSDWYVGFIRNSRGCGCRLPRRTNDRRTWLPMFRRPGLGLWRLRDPAPWSGPVKSRVQAARPHAVFRNQCCHRFCRLSRGRCRANAHPC